ncbi:STAS domain-containing protein [Prauserella rugosa]|uniref:Stage II sporulation protein AA (Anti-sigma F factor antagonist) n=1 Tax=Prauserella rugosa TaxID=43354 RepID=A0A660CJ16_9PSEU|nr:STAS domain-containing protein [Prauserella rugosa]KMS92218.1 anti-anti-sigma factor [Streptomyces regensis]TWH21091.1 stage II sporulation protein AA (anti-sigma F factor antagonist) [Prauserella rugosa]
MTTAQVEARAGTEPRTIDITVTGEIDLSNVDHVREEIYRVIANDLVLVRLDLNHVTYLDSSGLRILFALADRLHLLQAELAVIADRGTAARRIVELAGFDSVATLKP